jgi:tetratricopeptide (TPR) repeat protein
MKAEHRHELKTNALADTMGRLMQGLKTGPSRHTLLVWGVIGLIAVGAATVYFIWKSGREERSALWLQVDEAERRLDEAATDDEVEAALDKFKEIADKNPGTPQARVLRFDRARARFRWGLENLYSTTKRDKAVEALRTARGWYDELAKEPVKDKDEPNRILAQEALINVAKADESLGNLDEALKGYKALADAYPNSPLGQAAAERAKYLADDANRARAKQLYDKLNELTGPEAKPADSPGKK